MGVVTFMVNVDEEFRDRKKRIQRILGVKIATWEKLLAVGVETMEAKIKAENRPEGTKV